MTNGIDFDELTPAEQQRLRGLLSGAGTNGADPLLALQAIERARRRNVARVAGAVGVLLVVAVGAAVLRTAAVDGSTGITPTGSVSASPTVSSSPTGWPEATPSARATGSPTTTPESSAMSRSQAKAAFLAAYCPTSLASDSVYHVLAGQTAATVSRARVHVSATEAVDAYRLRYLALAEPKLAWPAEIRQDIARLADGNLVTLNHYQRLADARNGTEIMDLADHWPIESATVQEADQHVRQVLTLPDVGGDCGI